MSPKKTFLPVLARDRAGPEATSILKDRQERSHRLVPSPILSESPEDRRDSFPSIAARPSSSRRVKRSDLLPMLVEEKQGYPRPPSRCEPTSVNIPDLQQGNGITRKRAPAYMRTPARTRIPSGKEHSRSPATTPAGRKIDLTLPWID